jgi:uncharacterized protein (DUF427 family)
MDISSNASPGFARNPSKVIKVTPQPGTVAVYAGDTEIARSTRAKALDEPPYATAIYIPFEDIHFEQLQKTAHSTHCPYKGDASYWSALPSGEKGANAMWAYEHPYDEMTGIANHGAFYPDRVRIVTEG